MSCKVVAATHRCQQLECSFSLRGSLEGSGWVRARRTGLRLDNDGMQPRHLQVQAYALTAAGLRQAALLEFHMQMLAWSLCAATVMMEAMIPQALQIRSRVGGHFLCGLRHGSNLCLDSTIVVT